MTLPKTKYTKSGELNIAYQVFGSGAIDLVYIPGWVSNIDWMWACPELVQFFEALGKVARVILFDKRGTGLSDRVVEYTTLEERMEDITAVMNAAGSKKAILFGHSEGGSVSALYSATYPNRVISLIAFGIFAKRRFSKEYPWAPTDGERQKVYDMIENSWGGGAMQLESLAPSKADDPQFMNWLASYFRSGASPKAALKLTKMNTEVDITGILKYIHVPTLLMQRTHDIDVKIEEGKFIAKHIKNAKFVEFQGADHLFWAGNTQDILKEMITFIKNLKPNTQIKKGLFAVLYGQLLSQSAHSARLFNIMSPILAEFGGRILEKQHDYFLLIFEVPSNAVHCAIALREKLKAINAIPTFGICMKEVLENEKITIDEAYSSKLASIKTQMKPNQILVTPTIKQLLFGAPFNFAPRTTILDRESLRSCKLYNVVKTATGTVPKAFDTTTLFSSDTSFLENVVHIIEQNIEDQLFNVVLLSQKMGVSERQLQRKTKEVTGKSPGQLITFIRLHKAKAVLATNIYTIAEVAFQFGFSSPSYFSKCFKKEFGIQPTVLLQELETRQLIAIQSV